MQLRRVLSFLLGVVTIVVTASPVPQRFGDVGKLPPPEGTMPDEAAMEKILSLVRAKIPYEWHVWKRMEAFTQGVTAEFGSQYPKANLVIDRQWPPASSNLAWNTLQTEFIFIPGHAVYHAVWSPQGEPSHYQHFGPRGYKNWGVVGCFRDISKNGKVEFC